GLRLRGLRAQDGSARQEPAPQDRAPRLVAALRRDGARRRLPPRSPEPLNMSRLSVGARVTIAMTLIAIAAVLISVWLSSRAVDSSLNDFARNRAERQVAAAEHRPTAN